MLNIFLDTNVAFDLIANREPFVHTTIPFVELAEKGEVQLFISEISLGTMIYLAFERYKLVDAKVNLEKFVEFCKVISGGKEAFISSMNSVFLDKEDGLQYFTALANEIDLVITRDKKGFEYADGRISVLSPDEFLKA